MGRAQEPNATVTTGVSHKDLIWRSQHGSVRRTLCHSKSDTVVSVHALISMWNLQNLFTKAENRSLAGEEGGDVHQRTKSCSYQSKLHQHPAQRGGSSWWEHMVPLTTAHRGGLGALTLMYKGDEGTNCSDCVTDVTTSMQTSPWQLQLYVNTIVVVS